MRMFIIFTKKELTEQWKNYKILILFSVLAVFGMMSPILAKIMPDIFSQVDLGVTLSIPEPTFMDAYLQFFKNMTQLCLIIVILIFSGNVTYELQKGSAILMLSKGLSRTTFIISKFISAIFIWTIGYSLSAALCYAYTAFLFPSQTPQNVFFSMFCLWLLMAFVLSVIILTSIPFHQNYFPLLLTAGVLILLLLINIFPQTTRFSPLALGIYNGDLISGAKKISDVIPSLLITVGAIVACLTSAVLIFKKRQL
jgi:ABC-2 type transport system permease protein